LTRLDFVSRDNANQHFYDLVWPHLPAVLRLARILTGDANDAEDLAQETMLKAFRSLDQFQAGTDAKRWLTTILRNARIDRIRSTARQTEREMSLEQMELDPAAAVAGEGSDVMPAFEPGDDPQQILASFSDHEMIDALQQLPEEIRWTLLLVDVEGLNQEDAAGLLDVPLGTIKSRAHRGRAMLRKTLTPMVPRDRKSV
jgi:RNA polymerase sigma-70 factor (ECF subfamily)